MLRQEPTYVLLQKFLKEATIHFYCPFDESRFYSPFDESRLAASDVFRFSSSFNSTVVHMCTTVELIELEKRQKQPTLYFNEFLNWIH